MNERYVRKDGRIVWVRVSSRLIRDSAGRPLYFLPMIQDITEQLQVEKALRESEERYRRIVDTTTEGTLIADEDLRITFANPRLAEMLGLCADEMIGRRVESFIFEEDLADFERVDAGQAEGTCGPVRAPPPWERRPGGLDHRLGNTTHGGRWPIPRVFRDADRYHRAQAGRGVVAQGAQ